MTTFDDPSSSGPAGPDRGAAPAGISRRAFIGGSAAGVILARFSIASPAAALGTSSDRAQLVASATAAVTPAALNGWITINPDSTATIAFGGCEMGQGALTGLAQAAAEELMIPWSSVRTEFAPTSQTYITGGSSALRNGYQKMRVAGAQAREMLVAAAAATWGVPTTQCRATQGTVVNIATSGVLSYGSLASLAATQPVPASPPLTDPKAFRIVGKTQTRLDIPSKTTGAAIYGIDVRLPGMVYAAIVNCPTFGGRLASKPPVPSGATAVVPMDNAVAVVATNTWAAFQAARRLSAAWTTPADAASNSTAAIASTASGLLASGSGAIAAEDGGGDALAAVAGAKATVDATYSLPYLAHAYMEVLNCTVSVTATTCEVWVPTQAPAWVAQTAATITGLPADKITVHQTLLGGGLGRKIEQDYVAQALTVGKALKKPVKLTWSREQDMTHDLYRPMSLSRVKAGIDAAGNVVGWWNRIVTPSILAPRGWIGPGQVDGQAVDGAIALPYGLGAHHTEWVRHPATIPVGFWRSVGNSLNTFVVESAIDELALAAGIDPLVYRRRLLGTNTRALNVLNAAATLGGWGTALAAGHARGIALCTSFGSIAAQVVEISSATTTSMRVNQVAVAIDCGLAVNPGQVAAQMEGGVIHALNAALWGQITFTNGKADQANFNRYRMMRLGESPAIKVQVIQSGAPLGGVGEPGVPPLAPALANAHAALTKKRIRTLPFFPGATMGDI